MLFFKYYLRNSLLGTNSQKIALLGYLKTFWENLNNIFQNTIEILTKIRDDYQRKLCILASFVKRNCQFGKSMGSEDKLALCLLYNEILEA